MEKKMDAKQRGMIYACASKLGINEGHKKDNLHEMVYRLTGKESISELTYVEASKVATELVRLANGHVSPAPAPAPRGKKTEAGRMNRQGFITPEQARKVWALMYDLITYDTEPAVATPGQRLCKIIEIDLKITAVVTDPFRFVTFELASDLIECLKKYIRNEKRKVGKSNGQRRTAAGSMAKTGKRKAAANEM